ncbi:MAG TPA: sensor histidine kinase [Streptosporangiaceae bacterium]|nr:sensor histidine kinase [Streptosporangiaceae bacterium]
MSGELPSAGDSDRLHRIRRMLVSVLIVIALASALLNLHKEPLTASGWFLICGTLVFAALGVWRLTPIERSTGSQPLLYLAVMLGLGIALFVVGGTGWIPALAVAAGVCGRYAGTAVLAAVGSAACGVAGLAVGLVSHANFGETFSAVIVAPLAGFLAYSAARRAETVAMLRRTRAELARAAVAEERLRIARDLHDLLGHSLSLITLKAELAGRLLPGDPGRAAGEISELESVARQSLSDVREAVAGFRQPDLAGELAAARQLLDAAGIASQISTSDSDSLPQDVDSTLAWAVREGTTNVVRHSRATQVAIRVSKDQAHATAEIADNGPAAADGIGQGSSLVPASGPATRPAAPRQKPAFAGSGLAGLTERVRSLGGEIAAGTVEPHGFVLRVMVPLAPQA